MNTEKQPSEVGPVERPLGRGLAYEHAWQLYKDAREGKRKFVLHYHDREPRQITGIGLGHNWVYVEAGPMLPIHIRADGTSKDGPAIWLEAV